MISGSSWLSRVESYGKYSEKLHRQIERNYNVDLFNIKGTVYGQSEGETTKGIGGTRSNSI